MGKIYYISKVFIYYGGVLCNLLKNRLKIILILYADRQYRGIDGHNNQCYIEYNKKTY